MFGYSPAKRFLIWYVGLLVFAALAVGAYREVEHQAEWRQWVVIGIWTFIAAVLATLATNSDSEEDDDDDD